MRDPAKLRKGQVNHVGIYIGSDDAETGIGFIAAVTGYKTEAAPNGRVGISVNRGSNSYNPVDGGSFAPEMKQCNFTFYRRPQFAFK